MPIRIRSLSFTVVLLLTFAVADAANNMPIPAPPIIGAKSFLLLDGTTGTELASLEADKRLAPASLTKLMTAYVIFRALAADQIKGLANPGFADVYRSRFPGVGAGPVARHDRPVR
jgi:D-alanyl-D-alanine carboxypeptidase (penicillin-binding protein 5/6)